MLCFRADAVEDTQFLTLLEEVLGDRYGDLMLDTGVETSSDVDPLYAAAGYAAFRSLIGIEI